METRFCTQCGHKIPADSKFCPICGTKLVSNIKLNNSEDKAISKSQPQINTQSIIQNPNQISSNQNINHKSSIISKAMNILSSISMAADVVIIWFIFHYYEEYQNYRPYNQNQPGHPFSDIFADIGNNLQQGANALISPIVIAHTFLPWIVVLTIISIILFFIYRKEQNKILHICLLIVIIIMIIFICILSSIIY